MPGDEPAIESLEAIRAQRSVVTQTVVIDAEDTDTAEGIDLPEVDLSHEELAVDLVPEQTDEFTCGFCFLVRHRSQHAHQKHGAGLLHRLRGLRDCRRNGVRGVSMVSGSPLPASGRRR